MNRWRKRHLMLGAIATERRLMQFAGKHFDGVSESSALPRALALSGFARELDIERASDLGRAEKREPLEPSGSKSPFTFLDLRLGVGGRGVDDRLRQATGRDDEHAQERNEPLHRMGLSPAVAGYSAF